MFGSRIQTSVTFDQVTRVYDSMDGDIITICARNVVCGLIIIRLDVWYCARFKREKSEKFVHKIAHSKAIKITDHCH